VTVASAGFVDNMGCGRKGSGSSSGDELPVKPKNIYVAKSVRLSIIDWLHVARCVYADS
jgi:hypothetical protein